MLLSGHVKNKKREFNLEKECKNAGKLAMSR